MYENGGIVFVDLVFNSLQKAVCHEGCLWFY